MTNINLKKVLKGNFAKFVGLVLYLIFILLGAILKTDLSSKVNNNEILIAEIVKLKGFLSEKMAESNRCWGRIKDEFKNCNAEKYRELINKYVEYGVKDEEIEGQIKRIEDYINFQKKIELAGIFFKHVLKLIFILSGIFGLFWISIWKYREDRESKDSAEKNWIQQWESIEREKERMAEERLKVLELVISKKNFKFKD